MSEVSSTDSESSSTSSAAADVPNAGSSFIGNTPSTVLFFLALAVGVFIASLFVFFTIRYFVRSKYGLHIYPVSQRNFLLTTGGSSNLATMHHTTVELQEQLNYVRANHFIRSDIFDRRLNLRRRRRRRGRFSKMKKLTAEEVELLFPRKSYYDWLHGGQERDHENRDGVLHEEGAFARKSTEDPKIDTISSSDTNTNANASGGNTADIPGENGERDIELGDLSLQGSQVRIQEPSGSEPSPPQVEPDEELHFTSGSCAICLEVIEDDEIVRGLVCGHVFHAECLDPWLTKRRACCPMCKRDYYYKGGAQNNNEDSDANTNSDTVNQGDGANNNSITNNDDDNNNHNNDTNNNDNDNDNDHDGEDFDVNSIDVEVFRNDPTLRAMLQELIPIEERVRMILQDQSVAHLNLEAIGRETSNRKYGNIFKVIFWKIMGVSKQDLFNYGVVTAYHEYRVLEERRNTSMPNPTEASTAPETSQATAAASVIQETTAPQNSGPQQALEPTESVNANGDSHSTNQTLRTAQTFYSAESPAENASVSTETMREVAENRV